MTEPENRSQTRSLIKVESLLEEAIDVGDYITKKFDYEVKSDLYNHDDKCVIYDLMREIALDKRNQIKRPMIIMSPDIAISSATLSGTAERHMTRTGISHDLNGAKVDGVEFNTELRVLYISSKFGLCNAAYEGIQDYQRSVISNALGITLESFTNHNINLDPSNVIYLGIRKDLVEDSEQDALDNMEKKPMVFYLEDIRVKGMDRIMKFIKNRFKNHKVHVVFDLSVTSIELVPSAFRFSVDTSDPEGVDTIETEEEIRHKYRGLTREHVMSIMKVVSTFKLNKNLEAFDLVGYNFSVNEYRAQAHAGNTISSKLMIDVLKCVSDFTEHSINIFNESSKFLIWKKVPSVFADDEVAETPDDLIGWYILRNIDLNTRNELISHFDQIKIQNDNAPTSEDNSEDKSEGESTEKPIDSQMKSMQYPVERFEFPDDDGSVLDVLVSVTSPAEQNLKSYYTARSYLDRCLMPGEKVNMTFELLATPSAIQTLNKDAERLNDGTKDIDDDICSNDVTNDIDNDTSGDEVKVDPITLDGYEKLYRDYQYVMSETAEKQNNISNEISEGAQPIMVIKTKEENSNNNCESCDQSNNNCENCDQSNNNCESCDQSNNNCEKKVTFNLN
jgi:Arginase family